MEDDGTLIQEEDSITRAQQHSRSAVPQLQGYQLEGRLGEGSFGQVWRGVQLSTGQSVAVKMFTAQSTVDLSYIRRELERLRDVSDHPGVVGLIDANLEHATPYFVMPLLSRSLAQELQAPSPAQAEDWLRQLALALRHSHEKGLLHCDLKPSNVMLDESGSLRLVDFGQSCQQGDGVTAWGTLGFMAPEQARLSSEDSSPNVRWDVYGLGATLYRLLTGHCPYWSDAELKELTQQPLAQRLRSYRQGFTPARLLPVRSRNPQVDRDLADILEACLQIEPQRRLPDMASVLEDLARRRRGDPLLSRRPWTAFYRLQRLARRPTVAVSFVFTLVLLGGALYSHFSLRQAHRLQSEALTEMLVQRAGRSQRDLEHEEAPLWWAAALARRPDDGTLRRRLGQVRFALEEMSDEPKSFLAPIQNRSGLLYHDATQTELWESGQRLKLPLPKDCQNVCWSREEQRYLAYGSGGAELGVNRLVQDEVLAAAWTPADEVVLVQRHQASRWSPQGRKLAVWPLPAFDNAELGRQGQWLLLVFGTEGGQLIRLKDGFSRPVKGDLTGTDRLSPGEGWLAVTRPSGVSLVPLAEGSEVALEGEGRFGGFVGDQQVALLSGHSVTLGETVLQHDRAVTGLKSSPDGRYVMTSTDDDRICLWEVASQSLLTTRAFPNRYGGAWGFSSDSRHFFVCDEQQPRMWKLDPGFPSGPPWPIGVRTRWPGARTATGWWRPTLRAGVASRGRGRNWPGPTGRLPEEPGA